MDMVARAKNILLTPKTEWPVIAAEPATAASVFVPYVVILAAIPVVASFIGMSVFGISVGTMTIRVPFFSGLISAIVSYVLSLVGVYAFAKLVEIVAPKFGGRASEVDGLKLYAYAATAVWLAGALTLLPLLAPLVLVGALYSLYLLWLGVPVLTRVPEDKRLVFVLALIGCAIAIGLVIGVIGRVFH